MTDKAESNDNKLKHGKQMVDKQIVPAELSSVVRRLFLKQMVQSMPESVQNRIITVKNVQIDYLQLKSDFFKDVYELEKKYHKKSQPLLQKINDIVNGVGEPPREEPKWKVHDDCEAVDDGEEDKDSNKNKIFALLNKFKNMPSDTKGIPNFWLTIFRNTELLAQMVQDCDVPVLKELTDIKIRYPDEESFILEFYFNENRYFTNSVLTKQYWLRFTLGENSPFGFDGPEIFKCKGCIINWRPKKNLTIRTINKKQKHKKLGTFRNVTKIVGNETFFNYFNAIEMCNDITDDDEDYKELMSTDFEIGQFLRTQVIPHAILYFTGDVLDDEEEDEDNVVEAAESHENLVLPINLGQGGGDGETGGADPTI